MADESTTLSSIKTASDGTVQIAVERYNDLLETIASQKGSISKLRESLSRARNEPAVINRTVIEKTPEMVAQDHRVWGGSLMGLGASMFIVGAIRFRLSRTGS